MTYAPQSHPAAANRSYPSSRMSATHMAAITRGVMPGALGMSEKP